MVDQDRRRSFALALLPLAAAVRGSDSQEGLKDSASQPFGTLPDGGEVQMYKLGTEQGLQAQILTLGGTLQHLSIPVKGKRIPLLLSLPDLPAYLKDIGINPGIMPIASVVVLLLTIYFINNKMEGWVLAHITLVS